MMCKFFCGLWVMFVLAMIPVGALAKDQGSVLVYNLYTSGAGDDPAQNTRISITNTNETTGVAVHLFLVDGITGLVTDAYLCLAALQTAAFLASDVDPGVTGYVMAFATDLNGFPIAFDWLIGDEYVKLQSGYQANLSVEAISVVSQPSVFVSEDRTLATLRFDGVGYERLPRVLVVDSAGAIPDGNTTMLVVNHIGGSIATRVSRAGSFSGLLYDDAESASTFSFSTLNACQLREIFSNSFPRFLGSVPVLRDAGRTGWVKIWATTPTDNAGLPGGSTNDARAIFGAVLRRNSQVTPGAFSGGHNLHKLSLNPISFIQIPIVPPRC
jgi:hypothetical protein